MRVLIRELVDAGLLPTRHREGFLLLIRAYFDDSGTHTDSLVTVMGGLLGTVDQWEEFERDWARKLDAPLPGKPALQKGFHLSHCNAKSGEFSGYSDAEQDAVIHDFREIILNAKLTSMASCVDRRAWNELVVGGYRDVLGDALSVCFFDCIDEVVRIVQPVYGHDKIAIIFDEGIWSQRLQTIGEQWNNHQLDIVTVTFAQISEVLPLQGADIVATENYWHALDWLKRGDDALPRPHLRHYLANMLHQGRILDREAIQNEIARRGPDGRAP